jgi:hypothetical protein
MLRGALLLASIGAAAGARRALRESDLHYGLDTFNERFGTRAPELFGGDASRFHRRLFEHESALAHDTLQTFVVTLQPSVSVTSEFTSRLENRAQLTVHAVVGGDLLMHGTREHADALREQAEVRAVVPLLPELKLTPHFAKLLPTDNTTAAVSLNIRLVPLERHGHLRKPAADVAAKYTKALRGACESLPAVWGARRACAKASETLVTVESERALVVKSVERAEVYAVAELFASMAETFWIEPTPTYSRLNLEAVAITQSGSNPPGGGTPIGTTPIHDMGIHGEGEIIGVGDSGLDAGHCFFEDAQGDTAQGQTYGPAHRKIVGYRAYADDGATGQRDHGTHVVGSILGQASAPNAQGADQQGAAWAAKVSFTDIGPGDAPGLAVPNDLVNNFFNIDYDNGGPVPPHASPAPACPPRPRLVASTRIQALPRARHLYRTALSSLAATEPPPPFCGRRAGARIHSNSWGANINAYTIPTSDVDEFMAQNDDMLILFAAGNSGQQGPGSIGAPATCKSCLTVGASENNQPPDRSDGNVAVFSSQGPSLGRYKPDVVAPGFSVLSANSNADGDCPVTQMAGTSMATPITAGDVALIRQYFRQGFFPTGQENNNNGKILSGAAMKALAVHSSVPLTGTYQGAQLAPPPSDVQGFGRVQLNNVLFGPANANQGRGPGDRLLLVDEGAIKTLQTGEEHVYEIPLGTDPQLTSVKATLVWTDVAAQPLANNPLINNLDLEVTVNGQTLSGNGAPDVTNTIEQVVVPGATGSVTVKVKGTNVQQGAQSYALVVTGPLNTVSPPPAARSPPPPKPPGAPFDADAAATGAVIGLLAIGLGGGFCFVCFKKRTGGAAAGGGGGAAYRVGGGGANGLPAGWKQATDATTGATYYINNASGQSQWEQPKHAAGAGTGAASLPPGWKTMHDPATARTYYYNEKTGKTSWVPPE